MKSLRKVLSLLLVMALVLGFAACGEKEFTGVSNDDDDNNNNSSQKVETPTDVEQKEPTEKYIIYSDNAFAPFEYLEDGKFVGIDMELMEAIAQDQGFAYEMKNEGYDASMGAVQSGQADGMIAAITINEERRMNFDFSDGYFEDGSVLVVAQNSSIVSVSDLAGKTVAVKAGTFEEEYAKNLQNQYGFYIQHYYDFPTMYQAVLYGSADACFEDYAIIGWAIQKDNMALKIVGKVLQPCYYGFAVKKGQNAQLLKMFNEGLKNIKANGKYHEILAKYLG